MVTCPCNFGREPLESIGGQMEIEYVGSVDQNLRLKQVFRLSWNIFVEVVKNIAQDKF